MTNGRLGEEKIPFKAEVSNADGHLFYGWHMWHLPEWTLALHRNQVRQVKALFSVPTQSDALLAMPIRMVNRLTGEYLEANLTLTLHCEENELKTWVTCSAGPLRFALRVRRLVRMCKGLLCATKQDKTL